MSLASIVQVVADLPEELEAEYATDLLDREPNLAELTILLFAILDTMTGLTKFARRVREDQRAALERLS